MPQISPPILPHYKTTIILYTRTYTRKYTIEKGLTQLNSPSMCVRHVFKGLAYMYNSRVQIKRAAASAIAVLIEV